MSTGYARVNIIVEGQTEETFVRDVLCEPLAIQQVFVTAHCVETGRRAAHIYRGGMTSYAKARRDIIRWLKQERQAYVTTMFDLYRLPQDFPGMLAAQAIRDPYARIAMLEEKLADDIGVAHFIPYLQLHEFEGLLFSDVEAIDDVLGLAKSQLQVLQAIRGHFSTPELINDGETTAPAKRLKALYPGYHKTAFGPRIAARIGLATMRRECPHFDDWLLRLETLHA